MNEQTSPLVSVIMPCYKQGAFLAESVASVLNQTFSNLELLLVDDGSPDEETVEALKTLSTMGDPRLQLLHHPGKINRGVAHTRNLALDQARGSYIAFLDADDAWLPEKLEKQLACFRSAPDHVGMVFSSFYEFSDDGTGVKMTPETSTVNPFFDQLSVRFNGNKGQSLASMIRHPENRFFNWIQSPTPLVRRTYFDQGLRFTPPPTLSIQFEDYLMWLCLALRCDFVALQDPLALYRIHADQFTSTFLREQGRAEHYRGMRQLFELFLAEARQHGASDKLLRDAQSKFLIWTRSLAAKGNRTLQQQLLRDAPDTTARQALRTTIRAARRKQCVQSVRSLISGVLRRSHQQLPSSSTRTED